MNRLIRIGLAIAVAPALLLAIGNWTQSPDTIIVAEWVLFNMAIPVGGVLVIMGILPTKSSQNGMSRRQVVQGIQEKLSMVKINGKIWPWVLAFMISLGFAMSFGTTAKNKGDQQFLYVVLVLQAFAGTFLIHIFVAIFKWNSTLGFFGKVAAIAMLCFVLFGLTVCSSMSRTGWLGA